MPKIVKDTTTIFEKQGVSIKKAIISRIEKNAKERDKCLTEVSNMLQRRAQGDVDFLSTDAAQLMSVLYTDKHLTHEALVIKANIQRASELANTNLDLTCVARNLLDDVFYKLSLEDVKKYGLV